MTEFLHTLRRLSEGQEAAARELEPVVYDELRGIAAGLIRGERVDHTLQPTALVHEAYLRLAGDAELRPNDRVHFLSLCARLMRRVLVDHARARATAKRGGGSQRVTWNDSVHGAPDSSTELDVLELNKALTRLGQINDRIKNVVELRFFGGLTSAEIAESLGVSVRTIGNDWTFARAWLRKELGLRSPS